MQYMRGVTTEPKGPADHVSIREKDSIMIKIDEIPQYGKDQFDASIAAAGNLQKGVQAIAAAFGDYARKSFEDGNAFAEKLAGVKSFDKALEAQAEYAKSAYETFAAESQKIGGLYADRAKQAFKPGEGFAAKFAASAL